MRRTAWQGALLGLAAAVIAACGGSGGGGSGNNPTLTIAKSAVANGDNQVATVGTALTNNMRVVVTDDGDPVEGQVVTWATGNGSVTPTQSTTDQNGIATTNWTLGNVAGAQSMTASLSGAVNSPLTFSATGTPGPITTFSAITGSEQFAAVSTAFAQQATVKVADQFGNGISGVVVTWAVGSGSITPSAGFNNTGSNGQASVSVVAGDAAGPAVLNATITALATVLPFNLTVVPTARQVDVGSDFFTSGTNGTSDPAVDTLVVGQAMQWNLVSGTHTVHSTGSPSFTSSGNLTGAGYTLQFTTAGTYSYNCAIHGNQMTGTIVVQ